MASPDVIRVQVVVDAATGLEALARAYRLTADAADAAARGLRAVQYRAERNGMVVRHEDEPNSEHGHEGRSL